jgi:16S rRNA (guanine527-N7)-methyltransferase
MSLAADLAEGIAALGLSLPGEAQEKLLDYLALLEKWNATYNLTAIRERRDMLTHHLLDALAVIPHVRGASWLDVGSGAGLPGIPLALACADAAVTLVESSHKKAAFLRQAVLELGLRNVSVVCIRIEQWQAGRRFDVVISRALSDLPRFLALGGRLCDVNGVLAAMKGAYPRAELARLPARYRLQSVVPLAVPGLGAERHLVLIQPV